MIIFKYLTPGYVVMERKDELTEAEQNPFKISLEASSICQLKCPVCPTSKGEIRDSVIGSGFLKLKDFKNFVDTNPNIKAIELSNWGEIFLNPEIKDIIKYAYERKISLTALNGVNLNTIKEDVLESLVKYKFRFLTVSLDGATAETYKIYRKGGDFEKVIDNIKKINDLKRRYKSKFPYLVWQFVIFSHNEHELKDAKKMAEQLDMGFFPKLNWDSSFSPSAKKEFSLKQFEEKEKKVYLNLCIQFWTSPQINWDGKLLGCCVNKWTDFGNVFEKGLKECLNSEKYKYTKQMLLGKEKLREDIPCSRCEHYLNQVSKNPIQENDILMKLIIQAKIQFNK